MQEIQRFSAANFWLKQREYYVNEGVKAWQASTVPHYVTTNPTIAHAYMEVVFGMFRDWSRQNKQSEDPIYIVDLGAGSGRFAFYFLQALTQKCEQAAFDVPTFTYVISDFSEANLDFCRRHSHLQSFVEQGILDFALFDAETDDSLTLRVSNKRLGKNDVTTPLVLIANYFFDCLKQDLFYISGESLFSVYLDMSLTEQDDHASTRSTSKYTPQYHLEIEDYYTDPALNHLLMDYTENLENTHLIFPHVGIMCLEKLRQLSSEGFLLLSSDKGDHRVAALDRRGMPSLIHHGNSFSLSVNYHAIVQYFLNRGALHNVTEHKYSSINVVCLLALDQPNQYKETRCAYKYHVEKFGPDDFFTTKKLIEQHYNTLDLPHILAFLRLSNYDPRILHQCTPSLCVSLPHATEQEKEEVIRAIKETWRLYYPIGEKEHIAFDIGRLFYEIGQYSEALTYFKRFKDSQEQQTEATWFNMALCCYQEGQYQDAGEYLENSLAISPSYSPALALYQMIVEKAYHYAS